MNLCWIRLNSFHQNTLETRGTGISCKFGRSDSTPSSLRSLVMLLWGVCPWQTAWARAERGMDTSLLWSGVLPTWLQVSSIFQTNKRDSAFLEEQFELKCGLRSLLHSLACRVVRVAGNLPQTPALSFCYHPIFLLKALSPNISSSLASKISG